MILFYLKFARLCTNGLVMPRLILLNKPFNVQSQFSGDIPSQTLAHYVQHKEFYPAGRLDKDSEGLLLLTDNGKLQQRISDPKYKMPKVYWAQVEGEIDEPALQKLRLGVLLKDGMSKPAEAEIILQPQIWERSPPIRQRQNIPTSWLQLTIKEGRNRQVRRMTAATGFPTLRLIRVKIGDWEIGSLQPGESTMITLK